MSNCTIISLVPFHIHETKPGLVPPTFDIPPAASGDIEVLIVGTASFPVYMDEARGSLRVHTSPETLAKSLVDDYIRSQYGRELDAYPGIFWVSGEFTKEEAKKKFAKEILEAHKRQEKWFSNLVQLADDEWTYSHRYRNISETMRYAAQALGIHDKPWQAPEPRAESSGCPACGGSIRPNIVICPHCSVILDEEQYKRMKFATARV